VSFLGSKAQPGEQSIVNHEIAFEQSTIVIAGQCRQAKRYRVESGRFLARYPAATCRWQGLP
jgi:hypothetical protein